MALVKEEQGDDEEKRDEVMRACMTRENVRTIAEISFSWFLACFFSVKLVLDFSVSEFKIGPLKLL